MTPPPRSRLALVTSRDADPARQRKAVRVDPGQRHVLCDLPGAGRIVRLWVTLPLFGQGPLLKTTVVRAWFDGEADPSVEVPLGDLFGASFGRPRTLISDRLVVGGGAYVCRFEMPFNDGARLEVENQGARPIRYLFYQVGYYLEEERETPEHTFHAQYRRENPTTAGQPFTALQARGQGWLAGWRMDLQCRDWWLRPPLRAIVLPRGFGLGILEGWETITVDGDADVALRGTGTEDYFSGGFYFKGRRLLTPTHGCTHISALAGRASLYRLHVDDPVPFDESLQLALDHGLDNSMRADFTSVVYWYQREPHAPFPVLPGPAARLPSSAWINVVQWGLLAALAAGFAGLLAGVLHRIF